MSATLLATSAPLNRDRTGPRIARLPAWLLGRQRSDLERTDAPTGNEQVLAAAELSGPA
jgi:hypothetical protein